MLLQAPERRQQSPTRRTRGTLLRLQRDLVGFVKRPVLHPHPAGIAQRSEQQRPFVVVDQIAGLKDDDFQECEGSESLTECR